MAGKCFFLRLVFLQIQCFIKETYSEMCGWPRQQAKLMQQIVFVVIFEVLVQFFDFLVAVLCFYLPVFSNTKCDYSGVIGNDALPIISSL